MGTCQNISLTCAGGSYVSGLCPGDSSIRCCPDAPSSGGGGCKMKRDLFGRRVIAC